MAYLGRQLTAGNYLKLDDISSSFNGSTTTFNLTSGGSAHYPGSSYSILVSLGGIIQEPESAFTINQNQIVFATAPLVADDFFCISLGEPLNINVPGNGTVDGAQLKPTVSGSFNVNTSGIITATTFSGTFSGGIGGGNVNAGIGTFTQIHVGSAVTANTSGINVTGIVTATNVSASSSVTAATFYGSGSNLTGVGTNFIGAIGIQSGGLAIGAGVTQLNFIGAGNTFLYNAATDTVNISIAGGGGGAGGKFISGGTGIGTLSTVGFGTTAPVGTGSSDGIIQAVGNIAILDGALTTDQDIGQSITIPIGKNGLLIGPVTVGVGLTIDVAANSTLVVV